MIEKVTSPEKIVTDVLVLKTLAEQGIDKDYVEFFQDYAPRSLGKEHSPYAKFYRDLKSNKHIMVPSGLPMVKAEGHKLEVGWLYAEGKYYSKANLFSAIVKGKQIQVTCLSDQRSGAKKGDQVTWQPQLFINGTELIANSPPTLLPVDPINENYLENTLEWDYGVCKRRLRIVEGRIREKWVFDTDPKGEVRIKHNTSGNYPMRYGFGQDAESNRLSGEVIGDTEVIAASEFADAVYPVIVGASPETFYPDAGHGGVSVDGSTGRDAGGNPGEAWTTLRQGAGTFSADDAVQGHLVQIYAGSFSTNWRINRRGIFLFDTSALPDTCIITAAVLSLYGYEKLDPIGITPNSAIYASDPASNNALINADYLYTDFGMATIFSNIISYADFSKTGYNDYTLNSDGRNAISKIAVSKFSGLCQEYDAAGATPAGGGGGSSGNLYVDFADMGNGFKPKLVVTYYVPKVPVADGDLIGIGIIRKS